MACVPPEHEPEAVEESRSHELDLLDLIAVKNEKHRQAVERLHGFDIPDHQENEHDE